MKLLSMIMLGCLPAALAKSIIVTFSKDTPDSVVEDARQAIIDAVRHSILSLGTSGVILLTGFS